MDEDATEGALAAPISTEDPIVSIGADVDVRQIVDEIKAEVARKAQAGLYPPELMVELIASSDRMAGAVEAVRNTAHVEFRPGAESSRPLFGTALTFSKRSIRRLLRFQTMHMAGEVNTFAGNVATATALLAERIADLQDEVAVSRARVERLERRVRQLSAGGAAPTTAGDALNPRIRSAQAEVEIDYVEFEDRFRGTPEAVGERQAAYVDCFRGQKLPVIDIGCGRGEFLERLRDAGISAYGIDQSPGMVARCRALGVEAREEDAFAHLESLRPESVGGIFSAQVVEHFDPSQLVRFFDLAHRVLAPGGVFVAETLNPQSLSTFTGPLYVDLGHGRPLHPLTLQYIAQSVGFHEVELRFLSEIPEGERLALLPTDGEDGADGLVERMNANLRKIDRAMFGPIDFAVVGKR